MLSICIPIYNTVPLDLLRALSKQANRLDFSYEIILLNDASTTDIENDLNQASKIEQVKIYHNDKNLGRSVSRNKLGDLARYAFLLFIDGDSGMQNGNYLKQYSDYLKTGIVCCGGTSYQEGNQNKDEILRLTYGRKRESRDAKTRKINPYQSFTTHHFLIDKKVFQRIQFDTSIKGYGHEDTLFGLELKKQNIPIIHIDNSLYHLGIDKTEVFLNKTKEGVRNLANLYARYKRDEDFANAIHLVRFYQKQKSMRMLWIWSIFLAMLNPIIKLNLNSKHPSLKLFDLFKLKIFIKANNKLKNEE